MLYDAREYARLRNSVLALSLLAWLLLLGPVPGWLAPDAASAPAVPSVSYCGAPLPMHLGPAGANATAALPGPVTALASGWVLMLLAMMSPMLVPPIYHIRISSFTRRRARATALFVAGYGGVWLAAGVVLLALELAAQRLMPHSSYLPAVFMGLVAVGWQASPFKQRCLNQCHRHPPLAAFGAAADWDALRMGLTHGRWCTGSCWAAMLFAMLLPHAHLVGMAAVSALMFCERLDPPRKATWQWRGFGTAFRYLSLRLRGPRRSPGPLLART